MDGSAAGTSIVQCVARANLILMSLRATGVEVSLVILNTPFCPL